MNFPGKWEVNKLSIERSCVSRPADDRTGRLVLLSTISCLSWYESSYVISQFQIIILFLELSWLTPKKILFYFFETIFLSVIKNSVKIKNICHFFIKKFNFWKIEDPSTRLKVLGQLKLSKFDKELEDLLQQDSTPLVA